MKNTMLHMKLNSVSVFAVAAAFSVFLPSSNAFAGICFLPDCGDEILAGGSSINLNPNEDTEWCEKKGYTYYSSGKCPQYYAQIGKCKRDDYYLKCDAVTWCKQNGYNTQTCSLPSYLDTQCPNGKPYYKGCKEDRPRACREAGYSLATSCSSGRLYAVSGYCQWDSSYGTCCTASPSAGCPSNYAIDCDPSRGSSGTDTCEYTCYRCCSDVCSRGSKNYTGSYASTTECGSTCRYCKDCSSGSTYYSGSYAGTSECGTCYYCDDSCDYGSKSVSCRSNYVSTWVSSTECGSSCYECEYNSDCSASEANCSYGCSSYNSCDICVSCKSAPANTSPNTGNGSTGNGSTGNTSTGNTSTTDDTEETDTPNNNEPDTPSNNEPDTPSNTHSHSYSCPDGQTSDYNNSSKDHSGYEVCSCGKTNETPCYYEGWTFSCPSATDCNASEDNCNSDYGACEGYPGTYSFLECNYATGYATYLCVPSGF